MLERFKKERLRQSNRMGKMEVFNLNDDEEKGEMDLTHFGMSLDGLDRFDDVGLGRMMVSEASGWESKEAELSRYSLLKRAHLALC